MRGEDRVVRLDDAGCNLRGRINSEFKFGFLGVINSQTLKEKSTESRTGPSTERVEDENTLEAIA